MSDENENIKPEEGEEYIEAAKVEPPEQERPRNPRDEIYAKRKELVQQEMEQQESIDDPEQSATPIDSAEESGNIDHEGEELVTVKINGEERQVLKAKVEQAGGIVAYQKEVSAQERFQQAAEKERQIAERERMLAEKEAQLRALEEQRASLPQGGDHTQSDSPTDPPIQGDQRAKLQELVKAKNQAFIDGDDDRVAELEMEIIELTAALARPQQPQVDPTTIYNEAAQAAVQAVEQRQYLQTIEAARQKLFSEHIELKDDPRLFDLVDAETERVEQEHPEWEPYQIMSEAYKRVSEWRGTGRESQVDTLEQRRQEKRRTQTPRASTGRIQSEQPRRETRSDYVQKLKQMRGQVIG